MIRLSAIAPQITMKPYSHHAFCPKGTVAQSPEGHEQNKAFCISDLVAIAAIDNAPGWVSCNVNTGRRMPLGARLANLVEVSRNLCNQSGRKIALWRELTRHYALGSGNRMEQWTKELIFSCPFEELSLKQRKAS